MSACVKWGKRSLPHFTTRWDHYMKDERTDFGTLYDSECCQRVTRHHGESVSQEEKQSQLRTRHLEPGVAMSYTQGWIKPSRTQAPPPRPPRLLPHKSHHRLERQTLSLIPDPLPLLHPSHDSLLHFIPVLVLEVCLLHFQGCLPFGNERNILCKIALRVQNKKNIIGHWRTSSPERRVFKCPQDFSFSSLSDGNC